MPDREGRVVAVLGYSDGEPSLHPICASRVAWAERLAGDDEPVILSGYARRPTRRSEAELMRAAWTRAGTTIVCDHTARSTAENAANVAAAAGALGATELVVVTSRWHRRRARILFRAALRGRPVRLSVDGPDEPRTASLLAREVVCLAFVPFQLLRVRHAARRRTRR
jgi:predicted protein tyrosine phosphatase